MKKNRQKKRRHGLGAIERDIMQQLSLGDFLYAFLLSGRSSRAFYRLARERAAYRFRRKRAIKHLTVLGYVRERGDHLAITEKGRAALGETIRATRQLLGKRSWDGKWRIVSFDIPERFAVMRDRVRSILKRAGFVQLHRSVWIFPHECEELIKLIKDESSLSAYILYGVLERIENGAKLRKIFRV